VSNFYARRDWHGNCFVNTRSDMSSAVRVFGTQSVVAVVVVGCDENDFASLASILNKDCRLHRAADRKEAMRLVTTVRPQAVICDEVLADGDWRGLLVDLQRESATPLIVTSRLANDRLWAEVLNLGAFDLVARPFTGDELSRVVQMAARQRK